MTLDYLTRFLLVLALLLPSLPLSGCIKATCSLCRFRSLLPYSLLHTTPSSPSLELRQPFLRCARSKVRACVHGQSMIQLRKGGKLRVVRDPREKSSKEHHLLYATEFRITVNFQTRLRGPSESACIRGLCCHCQPTIAYLLQRDFYAGIETLFGMRSLTIGITPD
ncbi:hypothetical protein EI94DRAFT_1304436 [Lactarius quietus]|nr:hypothetical protein EI94DRAFT_1304436 [Lactarius quietus]